MEGPPAVVVDLGTYVVRVGLAGDDRPLSTFRALVHRDADGSVVLSTDDRVGQCPIDGSGAIVDVDGWLVLVREALRAAHVEDVAASPLLLVDRLSAMEHRPQVAALLFERVGVRKCALACQELAALVASGRLDGLVCHIGHRATTLVPMGRGVADVPAARTVSVGGYHIVASLREALETRRGGVLAASEVDQALARCFVAEQLPKQLHESRGASVDQRALFLAPEILFKPLMARVPWPVVRLLLIGRADSTSALYGLPKDLIRLILRHVRFAAVHDLNQRGIVEAMLEVSPRPRIFSRSSSRFFRGYVGDQDVRV